MRKVLLVIVLALVSVTSAFAQFNKGVKYLGASLNGFNLSYSHAADVEIGLGANAGYMFMKDNMIIGQMNLDFGNHELQKFELGGKYRYFFDNNGIFLSAGAKFVHEYEDYNDFQITPEVGWCYFLNGNLTIQPSVYYDISFSDFSEKSRIGLAIELGWFF